MDKKRVLYVVTQGEWGGAQRYIYDLAGSPEAQNWVINVAFGNDGDNALNPKIEALGAKIWPLKWLKRPISPIADILAVFELWRLFRQIRPDVIHLNSSKAGVVGSLASFLVSHKPYAISHKLIYTVHGWVFNEPMSALKKIFYLWAEKFTARFKDKIICVSEFDRQIALKYRIAPAEKLVRIHNGINIDSMEFLPKDEARRELIKKPWDPHAPSGLGMTTVIGTIANFFSTKGLEYLIEAVRLLITDYRLPITAIIIGDGELRPQLENLISKYNLQKNIFLAGKKENASKYLRAFDIYVCSSVKEGFPYSILEAMAAELPIIATKVGGIPEIIENNESGLLIEPRESGALAEKIKLLLNQPELADQLAANAQKKVKEKFLKSTMIQKTFGEY